VEFNHEELTVNALSPMNHPQKLTELYRCFYRAKQRYNPKANAVLKPIDLAAETLLKAEFNCFQGEALIAVVAAEISKLMDRVHGKTADGRWIFKNREEERQAILEFAKYFVEDVFDKAFMGDRARLAGRQLNLIRSTCEFLYRLADDKENRESKQTQVEEIDESDE
jgi:CRISPR-associated protein Csc3